MKLLSVNLNELINLHTLNWFVNSDWFKLIPIFSIVLQLISLVILYLGYKNLLKRNITGKQVDLVCEIIKEIQDEKIVFNYHNNGGYSSHEYTLFDISEFYKIQERKQPIIHYDSDTELFNFIKYSSNPLTPPCIANAISNFKSYPKLTLAFIELQSNDYSFVEVLSKSNNGEFFEYAKEQREKNEPLNSFRASVSNAKAFYSYIYFLKCTWNLKNEIVRWMKKQGISDLNIRSTDFTQVFQITEEPFDAE